MILPVPYQLFGPAQTPQSVVSDIAGAPKWVGLALSGSTHRFHFAGGIAPVDSARLLVVWASRNTANYLRLVACDDGPSNIIEIARIQGNGAMGPSVQAIDITAALNALIAAGVDKQIGFQIGGDGINQWTLHEVQLEINYEVGQ
jgi:hypothetical protein